MVSMTPHNPGSVSGASGWILSNFVPETWILNPLAPEPPVTAPLRIHEPSITCDVITLTVKENFVHQLSCVGWGDHSNHTRMSTIRSRRPEKKTEKKTCNADPKFLMKILFHYRPTFPKNVSHRTEGKSERIEKRKNSGGEKAKRKSQDCFLRMSELWKHSVNGFAVLRDQKKGSTCLKTRFSATFPGANGLREVN